MSTLDSLDRANSEKRFAEELPSSKEKSHYTVGSWLRCQNFPEFAQGRLVASYMYVMISDSFPLEQNIGKREYPVDEVAKATG